MNISAYPRIRLAVNLVLSSIIGVLASVLAAQIMPNGELRWGLLLQASSFWLLILFTTFLVLVQVVYLNSDIGLLKFADDLHCEAILRRAKLEAIVEDLRANPAKAYVVDLRVIRSELGMSKKSRGGNT